MISETVVIIVREKGHHLWPTLAATWTRMSRDLKNYKNQEIHRHKQALWFFYGYRKCYVMMQMTERLAQLINRNIVNELFIYYF